MKNVFVFLCYLFCHILGEVLNVLVFFWLRVKLITFLFLHAYLWGRERSVSVMLEIRQRFAFLNSC